MERTWCTLLGSGARRLVVCCGSPGAVDGPVERRHQAGAKRSASAGRAVRGPSLLGWVCLATGGARAGWCPGVTWSVAASVCVASGVVFPV
jgi:hypothetical protein